VTEFSCVAIALALCLEKKKKNRRWMKEWYKKRNKYTHENLLSDLRLSEPNDFNALANKLSFFFFYICCHVDFVRSWTHWHNVRDTTEQILRNITHRRYNIFHIAQ
jgi:hypothetical protein